ncbi:sulfur carrier protein ThiS [Helicobacter cetorum]|uniref:sulfur carrier protein ThiS n=1 Tax=Helicobacter cetorum TaxID=138563 RepID=UPI000CF154C9|nr:sulfur carrier protein ThiS [Helicobacter cetorum]
MKVIINGETRELPKDCNVSQALEFLQINPEILMIALNCIGLKKELWDSTILKENDKLECLQFMGGG